MPHLVCDFNPVDRMTVGTIGPPGKRVFLLQAGQGSQDITLLLEKEQARTLALGLIKLLEHLKADYIEDQNEVEAILAPQMELQMIAEPEFRIGQIGIGFDQDSNAIVILAYELAIEKDQDLGMARFWLSMEQARALAQHALDVVESGRPVCPLCGRPIDPEGHSCPRSNGHGKTAQLANSDFDDE